MAIAASFALMLACASARDTMQESVDLYRNTVDMGENMLRIHWDQFRIISQS